MRGFRRSIRRVLLLMREAEDVFLFISGRRIVAGNRVVADLGDGGNPHAQRGVHARGRFGGLQNLLIVDRILEPRFAVDLRR